jgi:hypothetical protein
MVRGVDSRLVAALALGEDELVPTTLEGNGDFQSSMVVMEQDELG